MASDHHDYFCQLNERVPQAVKVPFCKAQLDGWEPAPGKCHENVDHWVRHHPECAGVRGWIFWPRDESGRCRFMAHSVVEENGKLLDITPIDPNTPRETLVFLRHLGTEEEFNLMKTDCAAIVYPPPTWEDFHAIQNSSESDEAEDIDL